MSELLLGKSVGRCRIEKILGQGGMGAVYQGTHEALRIPVAVKFLSVGGSAPGSTAVDGSMATRFMREAQLAATLRHPNIVRIYDVNNEHGLYFIIMELLAGTSLASQIETRGALPIDEVKHVGHQIAAALAHAHAKGVIHRDIKPDNVMIAFDGTAVLTDFGIAAADRADPTGERLTGVGNVVGTPWYLAPEQARGTANVDGRADIYALGVMLYEMLTGTLPFDGDSPMAQMLARLTTDPTPIATHRKDVPPEIVTLVSRMLAREPGDRVQTADEVAQALGHGHADRTVAPPMPMDVTMEVKGVTVRASELTAMADSAGLPFTTPQGAHMVELRMADIRATLRLAEEESSGGASLFLVHRLGEADVVGFVGKRAAVSARVVRGFAAPVSVSEVLAAAMRRGDGACVVRKIEPAVVNGLRCWLEGHRALGPIPVEVIRPMGLFARLRRSRTSGVLAITDRAQTSLVAVAEGKVTGLLSAPLHKPEIATESEGGIGVWMESCGPDALIAIHLAIAQATPSAVSAVPDELLMKALTAAVDAAAQLAQEASQEFGLGSGPVFSKYLREATSGFRDVVPVAALSQPQRVVDVATVWQSIAQGANTGRDVVVRMVAEALLTGAMRAAAEVIPAKKLAKVKLTVLTAMMKTSGPALETLGLVVTVQRVLGDG